MKGTLKVCPYQLSLASSLMPFVHVSVFHTCFETAREDNVRRERAALLFPSTRMLGLIQAGAFPKTQLYQAPAGFVNWASVLD